MRVLSIVNSPAFMLRSEVHDVQRAAALLGVRGLRNLALSLIVTDMVPNGEAGRLLLANSLRRALAARLIAGALGHREVDAFFTAGLFLEAGLLMSASEDGVYAAEIAQTPAGSRTIRERAAGKDPHPITGKQLAESYSLPASTVAAIEHHHDEECPEGDEESIAWLAERVAAVFEGGDINALRDQARDAAESMGVSAEAFESILGELPEALAQSAAAFDRDIGEVLDLDTLVADATRALVELNGQYEGMVRQLQALIEQKEALETELREANEILAMQATTDTLTGLPNKRALEAALHRDLARAAREGQELSLVVIDIDHFKKFNDTWGHAIGDEVLKVVGTTLMAGVRTGDLPARYGGEEFVLVLPNTGKHSARIVAERVRAALEAVEVPHPEGALKVTASFGIAAGVGGNAQELFVRADEALYEAKRSGRNRVCLAA